MKLGDLIFGIKADKSGIRKATSELKKEFSDLGSSIEKSLGKNTIGGMEKRLDVLKDKLRGVNVGSKEFRVLQKEIQATEKRLDAANGKVGLFSRGLKLVGVAIGYLSLGKLRQVSDTFTSMQNRIRQIAEGEEIPALQQKIFKMAQDARVPVDALTSSFVRFDLINKQLGGTQEETAIMLDTLSKGLSTSGASAEETGSLMLQLSQAFGSGVLSGDEFRAVSEAMPSLLDILAKQLGVNRGELKKMSSEGLITSKVLKDALLGANEEVNASFQKSSITIGQVATKALNRFIMKFGELDQTHKITEKTTKLLEILIDTFFKIIDVVIKFGGVIKELTIVVGSLLAANALLGLSVMLRSLPSLFGAASLGASALATANTILAGTLARLGIASTTALGPLAALAAAIYGVIYAYRQLKEAQDVRSSAQISAQGVRGQIADTTTNTAREIQRIKKENESLAKDNSIQAREQLKINQNNLQIEQQKLKTQNLILQQQTLNTQGKYDEAEILQKSVNNEQKKLASLRDQLGLEKRALDLKKENVSLSLETPDFSNLGGGGGGGTSGGYSNSDDSEKAQKELEKQLQEQFEAEKKQAERLQKYKEDQVKKENDLLKKKYEFIGETIGKITNIYDEEMEKSSDAIDDYIKKIEDLEEKLVDISDERQKNKERLFDFGSIETQRAMERTLQNSGAILDVAGNDETVNGFRVGDLRDFKNLQDAQNKLNEQEIVAQQELENLRAKKEIEDTIFAEFAEKRASIDENYKKVRLTLESQITESVFQESIKQESVQDKLLKKWKAVAQARRDALGASRAGESVPGFAQGGYTGDGAVNALAGVVHAGEYVIPQRMVKDMPDVISALERMRQGGNTITNNKSIQVPSMVVQNQLDAELFFDKLKFKL